MKKHKKVFAGECKYHAKPVDAVVYFGLKEKVERASDIKKAFSGYDVIYGIFSKSGFTNRMIDVASENDAVLLLQEDKIVIVK